MCIKWEHWLENELNSQKTANALLMFCQEALHVNPVDTRRRFNVYKTSIRRHRRRIDVL